MAKYLKVVLAIVAFAVVSIAVKFGIREYQNSNQDTFDQDMVRSIQELNQKTPIKMDDNRTLTEVLIEDKLIIYKAKMSDFDLSLEELEKIKISQKISTLFFICYKESSLYGLKKDYEFRYDYSSPDGSKLFSNHISNRDCSPFVDKSNQEVGEYFVKLQKQLLPMKLDSDTNLVDVKNVENTIDFTYQLVGLLKNEIDLIKFENDVKFNSTDRNCGAPESIILFKNGFSISDTYIDRENRLIYSFKTSKDMCEST